MRNFWIETDVDGRASTVAGGPRRNDGTMSTNLYVNSNGISTRILRVACDPQEDTKLKVYIQPTGSYNSVTITADKKSGEIHIHNSLKEQVKEVLDDKSITPTARLKKIAELISE